MSLLINRKEATEPEWARRDSVGVAETIDPLSPFPSPYCLSCMPAQLPTATICIPWSESFLWPPEPVLSPYGASEKCQWANIAPDQGWWQLPWPSGRKDSEVHVLHWLTGCPKRIRFWFNTVIIHLIAFIGLGHLSFPVLLPHSLTNVFQKTRQPNPFLRVSSNVEVNRLAIDLIAFVLSFIP